MDIHQHLILLKGEDRTENIAYCQFQYEKALVRFSSGRTYRYSQKNVQWLSNPDRLDPSTLNGSRKELFLSGVEKALDFGPYIRVFFQTGETNVFDRRNINFGPKTPGQQHASEVFAYLKQVAQKINLSEEEDDFLSKQYGKISKNGFG